MVTIPLSSDEEIHGKSNANVPNFGASTINDRDIEADGDELEEKGRLTEQVFQLQNTLDDLAQRVDAVKDENVKLKSENQILGQYIENLMAASSVFQGNSKGKVRNEKQTKDGKK